MDVWDYFFYFYIRKVKLVKSLGGGSFAQVWLAENISTSEKFAVKIMDYSNEKTKITGKNEEIIEQSISLKSPYLIKYLQSFEVKKKKFIVMEYCEHRDLQELYVTCKELDLPIVEEVFVFLM
jgi:serine/threonine protein kinase